MTAPRADLPRRWSLLVQDKPRTQTHNTYRYTVTERLKGGAGFGSSLVRLGPSSCFSSLLSGQARKVIYYRAVFSQRDADVTDRDGPCGKVAEGVGYRAQSLGV